MDLLVVDDDPGVAALLTAVLRSEGHEVRTAADGQGGLAEVRRRKPDLVLLDVEMPVLTGPEMAYRLFIQDCGDELIPIRGEPREGAERPLSIVLLSGVVDLPDVARVVGSRYFLSKPYTLDAPTDVVRRALAERAPPCPAIQP